MDSKDKEKAKLFAKQILALAVEQKLTFSEYAFALKEANWEYEIRKGKLCSKCNRVIDFQEEQTS